MCEKAQVPGSQTDPTLCTTRGTSTWSTGDLPSESPRSPGNPTRRDWSKNHRLPPCPSPSPVQRQGDGTLSVAPLHIWVTSRSLSRSFAVTCLRRAPSSPRLGTGSPTFGGSRGTLNRPGRVGTRSQRGRTHYSSLGLLSPEVRHPELSLTLGVPSVSTSSGGDGRRVVLDPPDRVEDHLGFVGLG